ncbi:MAG: bifunctional nuclease family protein [Leptospiraceae bacterium]|nr:bifunctional nuclease family protein [Leptospiraceae bacterium]
MNPPDALEVEISDVSITNVGFAIFLKAIDIESQKVVPIFIGPLETYSISSALEGSRPPRPNTHDLMINMLDELETKVLYVIVNDVIGSIYYARIVLENREGIIEMDSRPSDSIAVAIRCHCPIYMHPRVYTESAIIIGAEQRTESQTQQNSEPDSDTDIPAGGSEIERMQLELQNAVENENFEKAAILRDKINHLRQEN